IIDSFGGSDEGRSPKGRYFLSVEPSVVHDQKKLLNAVTIKPLNVTVALLEISNLRHSHQILGPPDGMPTVGTGVAGLDVIGRPIDSRGVHVILLEEQQEQADKRQHRCRYLHHNTQRGHEPARRGGKVGCDPLMSSDQEPSEYDEEDKEDRADSHDRQKDYPGPNPRETTARPGQMEEENKGGQECTAGKDKRKYPPPSRLPTCGDPLSARRLVIHSDMVVRCADLDFQRFGSLRSSSSADLCHGLRRDRPPSIF
ncbi:MAG: hypothetical protein Q4P33_08570, partial [Flaviflexus sp.]|nr:hypothetical protein [Flaviflexus sp.]